MKKTLVGLVVLLVAVAFLQLSAQAQTFTSTIQGTVTDAKGGALPSAAVHVKGVTVDRSAETNGTGFYRVVELPAGTYTVTVSHDGFATKILEGVVLVLDRTAEIDVSMQVASRTESVTVTAEVPLLDTAETSVKQVIESREIDSIPLNGRNYLDLILLTPGVVVNTQARADLTNRDTNGAIMGERAGNTAYLIDGLDNNDDFHGGVFQAFTQDAIQEFEVIDTGFKAEFGHGSAAVVNVVSKTGSNAMHGSGFLYARNDALDTSNVSGANPPQLSRYDFGGTFGMALKQDKAWFFGSVERVQETRGAIFPPDIPDILLAGENFSILPEDHDTRVFTKYTEKLTKNNEIRVSFSWTRANLANQLSDPIALPSASVSNITNTWLGTVSLTSLFGPHLVLDSSFNARAQNFDQNQGLTLGLGYEVFFVDDATSFDFGPPPGSVQSLQQKYYTGREVLSWFPSEHHATKFGFEYTRTIADGVNGQDLQSVLLASHASFALYGLNSLQIPQGIAFVNPGDNISKMRNNGVSFFAQDDWHIFPTLILSGGLRYDYDSRFGDTNNIAPRLGLAWSPDKKTVFRSSFGMFYDRYRLGIAQAVPGLGGFNGTTVVEFNYPVLADDSVIPLAGSISKIAVQGAHDPNFLNTHFGIPVGTVVNVGNIQTLTGMTPAAFITSLNTYLATFNIPFVPADFSPSSGFLRQDVTGNFEDQIQIQKPFHTPYNNTFTVGIQRQLTPSLSISATYIRRSIRDILGVRITNLSPASAAAGTPITTDGGPIQRVYGPWYDGKYSGVVLTLNKRFSRHFQVQANYTYAQSTDDLLNSNLGLGVGTQGGGAVPTDNNNLEFDRGNSDLFVPHVFVGSGVYEFPYGIHVSGVFRATSGVYFTAVGPPIDYDGDGISSTRPRTTRRNQFRGPSSANLDLRFEKDFRFAERFSLAPLVEFFNITNQANPELINNSFVGGAPGPDFGSVRVPLPGREVQFGLRFNF
ncbi:MAG: TonB-dependent receptor [Candidatus Acidiferrales bacterium]